MRFGIFIYDGVEPIDLAAFGVLSMARRIVPEIDIVTIAPHAGLVQLANGLAAYANYGIDDAPQCEWVIVTGGPGWVEQATASATLEYFRRTAAAGKVASVCTGAMVLAAAGVLEGHSATTKREVVAPEVPPLQVMRAQHPKIHSMEASIVDAGSIVTGGGVTLCIDTTLYLLERTFGPDVARETARILEYERARRANAAEFPMVHAVNAASNAVPRR